MKAKGLLILAILAAAVFVTGAMSKPELQPVNVTYIVEEHQTLWHIAGELKEQYQDPRDIREIIYYIAENNDTRPVIHAGQSLNITMYTEAQP